MWVTTIVFVPSYLKTITHTKKNVKIQFLMFPTSLVIQALVRIALSLTALLRGKKSRVRKRLLFLRITYCFTILFVFVGKLRNNF